ncbi:hypothetical protein [Halospeciosus flavus]|uniref:Uncharacterized protein n=1 Tax=Halospeciosus flavus TaxID=3032283 RepID=A0ABD5Z2X4_9EURY|nr:hypothetical protein [Halospeciosus flavus]
MNHTDNFDALRKDALESVGQLQTEVETVLAESGADPASNPDADRLDRLYYVLDEMQAELMDEANVESLRELEN